MTTDELVKIILALSVSVSLILVAFGIYKLLKDLAGGINDLRHSVKNVNELTDMTLGDYKSVRSKVASVFESVESGVQSVNIFKLIGSFVAGRSSKRRGK